MNKRVLFTLAIGAVFVAGGACLAKWVSVEGGGVLIGAGGYLLGWVRQQPGFAR